MIEIRVIGLRRSGNHAIMNWIAGLFDGVIWYFNDCVPTSDPFTNRELTHHLPCLKKRLPITGDNPDVVMHSYEDRQLTVIRDQPRISKRWNAEERFDVLILRDPFNTLASLLEISKRRPRPWAPITGMKFNAIWKQYARVFSGTDNLFPNLLPISFNRWFTDIEYRRLLADTFHRPLRRR
jgi:hypothetical protein